MLDLRKYADSANPVSFGNRCRARRFQQFSKLIARCTHPVRILDVGGTTRFWELRGWAGSKAYEITTLNLEPEPRRYENVLPVVGDATDMHCFADGQFDVAFSNSVIEHLFTLEKQAKMAAEVQRVARAHWVQTPNYWFPVEPHFHLPGWQWYPEALRVWCIRRFRCGWRGPCRDVEEARRSVREVRLLTRAELRLLFPRSELRPERFCGLVKSWVALFGFDCLGSDARSL